MSRSTVNTKCRLCRTEGTKLFLKGARCLSAKCPLEKKGAIIPGMHGLKRAKKLSDYGQQLRAKQKAKRFYGGLTETQFKNYYTKAKKLKGLVGANLLTLLERRLDNVVYSAGLSLSRSHARSLVSHRQVLVNGVPLNIASYSVKVGDLVALNKNTTAKIGDLIRLSDKDFKAPQWLDLGKSKFSVKIISLPIIDPILLGIDINLIIEYYSR